MTENSNGNCGCCTGIESVTPLSVRNRPGLDELRYRIGTHSSFFESMLARLTTYCDGPPIDCRKGEGKRLLRDMLTTRKRTDPAIAMLDAWSVVADILTFYQERIANEGFLRSANELRSLYELSRLVGYTPRPGVSASVYLAFEVEPPPTVTTAVGLALPGEQQPNLDVDVEIPKGTQVKSTPAPGTDEKPQTFETSQDFRARPAWNILRPRLTAAQKITPSDIFNISEFYFQGTGLRLSKNDYLALVLGRRATVRERRRDPFLFQIKSVEVVQEQQITRVELQRDDLSIPRLLEDLEGEIDDFLAEGILAELLTKAFRDVMQVDLRGYVQRVRENPQEWLLPQIDHAFDELICSELLRQLVPKSVTDGMLELALTALTEPVKRRDARSLRMKFEDLSRVARELQSDFDSQAVGSLTSTRDIVERCYHQRHRSLLEQARGRKEAIEAFIPLMHDEQTRAEKTIEAKRFFWDPVFGPIALPRLLTIASNGPQSGPPTSEGEPTEIQFAAAAGAKLAKPDPEFPKLFLVCSSVAPRLSQAVLVKGITPAQVNAHIDSQDIEARLHDLSLPFEANTHNWLRLEIRQPDPSN